MPPSLQEPDPHAIINHCTEIIQHHITVSINLAIRQINETYPNLKIVVEGLTTAFNCTVVGTTDPDQEEPPLALSDDDTTC